MRRLFIDPGSQSMGYAFVDSSDGRLVSGTIKASGKHLPSRIHRLFEQTKFIFSSFAEVDEVHVETLVMRTHHVCIWSVGIVAAAAGRFWPNVKFAQDIPIKAWQKHCDWDKIENTWKEKGYGSEDEMAAVCMARFYLSRNPG